MSKREKNSIVPPPESPVSETVTDDAGQGHEAVKSVKHGSGPLLNSIIQKPISEIRPGDLMLYPGNRLIKVHSVDPYVPLLDPLKDIRKNPDSLSVVTFEGQPDDVYIAFNSNSKVYVYAC